MYSYSGIRSIEHAPSFNDTCSCLQNWIADRYVIDLYKPHHEISRTTSAFGFSRGLENVANFLSLF